MIRALEATDIPIGPWRRALIEYDEQEQGVSLFLFADPTAELPDRDYAFGTLEQAKEVCRSNGEFRQACGVLWRPS